MFGKKRDCEPEVPKKCKETKVVIKHEDPCMEPLPPDYEEKTYFLVGSPDPVNDERAKCLEHCSVKPILDILRICDKRVTRKILYTAETCHDETVDLMEALDKCVKDKAFNRLA